MLQLKVINSPFNEEQVELLNRVLPSLSVGQQHWLSGYLTGYESNTSTEVALLNPTTVTAETNHVTKEVTVLFGSQTGNCQVLSEDISKRLEGQGYTVTLSSMNDFKANDLKKVSYLLILVSTQGEGDPPDTALPFYEFLHSRRAPKLEALQFSVLSLGDSSYELFCQTGKQFDARLEELGAKRLSPRVDCDLDYDEPAAEWFEAVTQSLNENMGEDDSPTSLTTSNTSSLTVEQSSYSRTNPYKAEVFENLNLNGRGSNKETRHLELSLEGSNLAFEPGDSLGIYPENDAILVDSLIKEMGWNPEDSVPMNKNGEERSLRDALINNYEITVLTKPLLQKISEIHPHKDLAELLQQENEQALRQYFIGRDLLDLARDFAPWEITASEFVKNLRKLPARLYSIASSYKANPEEVHLTIGAVRYEAHGRNRNGVCSVQCSERVEPGDTLSVYVQKNVNFKLPTDPNVPIIMIGPGTGVAPFRAFLEEREEIGAQGKSWLFFGDQHYVTDFLYQIEWQRWLKSGVLTNMDVAFSRDTENKVYVQHRMLEKSKELYQWLIEGAYVYICGDEKHMANDVHATLIAILEQEGAMEAEEAADFLTEMQQEKRYQRDVY